jgi:predicted transcriptional regulator
MMPRLLSNKDIGDLLGIAKSTVNYYLNEISPNVSDEEAMRYIVHRRKNPMKNGPKSRISRKNPYYEIAKLLCHHEFVLDLPPNFTSPENIKRIMEVKSCRKCGGDMPLKSFRNCAKCRRTERNKRRVCTDCEKSKMVKFFEGTSRQCTNCTKASKSIGTDGVCIACNTPSNLFNLRLCHDCNDKHLISQKRCIRCRTVKYVNDYYREKRKPAFTNSGYQAKCKKCFSKDYHAKQRRSK